MVLPIKIKKNKEGKFSIIKTSSLLYSRLYKRDPDSKIEEWWIGWASYFPENKEEEEEIFQLFREQNCIPIIFEEPIIDEFYNFYEKQVIPLFHNFKTHFDHKESYDQFDDWD